MSGSSQESGQKTFGFGGYRDIPPKIVYFYREGEKFSQPRRVAITPYLYPNFNLLINYLNRKVNLPQGVRAIFTPKGRQAVLRIDEFEHNGHYICSSNLFRGKETDINRLLPMPRAWHGAPTNDDKYQPGRDLELFHLDIDELNRIRNRDRFRHASDEGQYRDPPPARETNRTPPPTTNRQQHLPKIEHRTANSHPPPNSQHSQPKKPNPPLPPIKKVEQQNKPPENKPPPPAKKPPPPPPATQNHNANATHQATQKENAQPPPPSNKAKVVNKTQAEEQHKTAKTIGNTVDPVKSPEILFVPTVIPEPNFDVVKDCERLYMALEGSNTDEETVIDVLTKRSWQQRGQIEQRFRQNYHKPLDGEIQRGARSNFLGALTLLLQTPVELAAYSLNQAMTAGVKADEITLIEIICTKSNDELQQIKEIYQKAFGNPLEHDVRQHVTNPSLQLLLVALINRPKSPVSFDLKAAKADANAMHQDIQKGGEQGADKLTILLSSRGQSQLRDIFENYKAEYKVDVEEAIKKHFPPEIEPAFSAVVGAVQNKPLYFAKRIYASMEGTGTRDAHLVRLIVSRCEVDLANIKIEFEKLYHTPLVNMVRTETSGDYENTLVALVNGNNPNQIVYNKAVHTQPPQGQSTKTLQPVPSSQPPQPIVQQHEVHHPEEHHPQPEHHEEHHQPPKSPSPPPKTPVQHKVQAPPPPPPTPPPPQPAAPANVVYIPTVTAEPHFDVHKDCEVLMNAMKGVGSDEEAIINILTKRSWQQRAEIEKQYRETYKTDLESVLKNETNGYLHITLAALLKVPIELAAYDLNKALKAANPDEETIIEIICTKSNEELQQIKQKYHEMFGQPLEIDIRDHTVAPLQNLLVALINRPKSPPGVDLQSAQKDAKEMHEDIMAGGSGTDRLIALLAGRGQAQLRQVFAAYKAEYHMDIEESIRQHFASDIETALLAVVGAIQNKPLYFATRFNASMEGSGVRDEHLLRLVVSRCEVDLANIKQEFEKLYRKPLVKVVETETSGDYRATLVSLIHGNNSAAPK